MFQTQAGSSNAAGNDPMSDPQAQEWERHYSTGLHLTLLAFNVAVPLVPAVVMYLIKKDESPFVADHGREAINFQISLLIYGIIGALLIPACGSGIVVLTAVYVLGIIGMIFAAMAANKGRYYRYPACLRFLSK